MSTSHDTSYFDLHTRGLGYLNRVREVTPAKGKKGKPFWACDINALVGASDDPSYTHFDVNVVKDSDAEHLVRRCKDAVDAEKKVLIGFLLGDLSHRTFTYTKGNRIGETGVSLKSRLLYVYWIKVDGEMVYKAEPKAVPADESGESARETQFEETPPAGNALPDAPQANDDETDDADEVADTQRAVGQSF